MARLIPADKGTHFLLGGLVALLGLALGGAVAAALLCAAVAVGREIYGWRQRGWRPFQRDDWLEAGLDIAFTLGGGGLVLAAAAVGL